MKLIGLAIPVGIAAGLASALFLSLLALATATFHTHHEFIYALPVVGFAIGWIYLKFGRETDAGNSLIIDEIHDPKKQIPLRMAPFVLLGTLLSHLFGASVGREGTAVQMGASLAEKIGHTFKIDSVGRRSLLVTGMGAGFGSAIGAPLAGAIFGLEVLSIGRLRYFAVAESLVASYVGYWTVRAVGVEHTRYDIPPIPGADLKLVLAVAGVGLIFGLCAFAFTKVLHFVERRTRELVAWPPLRPFIGGLLILAFVLIEGSYRYCGLGLDTIQEAIRGEAHLLDPLFKSLLSAVSVGSGFKGGEFIPIVFIGATLGSLVGSAVGLGAGFFSALGFASVFGAAANTPLACAVMACELFGWGYAPYALLSCFAAYLASGHHGIYKAQRVDRRKHHWLQRIFRQ